MASLKEVVAPKQSRIHDFMFLQSPAVASATWCLIISISKWYQFLQQCLWAYLKSGYFGTMKIKLNLLLAVMQGPRIVHPPNGIRVWIGNPDSARSVPLAAKASSAHPRYSGNYEKTLEPWRTGGTFVRQKKLHRLIRGDCSVRRSRY